MVNEIVFRSKFWRNSVSLLFVVIDKFGNFLFRWVFWVEEYVVVSFEVIFINFELVGVRFVVGVEGVWVFVYLDDDGVLGVGLLLLDGVDFGVGLDRGGFGGWGVVVVVELGGVVRGDGVVVGLLVLDYIFVVGWGEVLVVGVGFVVDDVVGDGIVGVDVGGEEVEGVDEGG